jgi:hypothetical protein
MSRPESMDLISSGGDALCRLPPNMTFAVHAVISRSWSTKIQQTETHGETYRARSVIPATMRFNTRQQRAGLLASSPRGRVSAFSPSIERSAGPMGSRRRVNRERRITLTNIRRIGGDITRPGGGDGAWRISRPCRHRPKTFIDRDNSLRLLPCLPLLESPGRCEPWLPA